MAEKKTEKLVTIELFRDGDKYKDDVFVCINGRSWQIKRGEEVKVPESVAKALAASKKQDNSTEKMIQKNQDDFREASKNI